MKLHLSMGMLALLLTSHPASASFPENCLSEVSPAQLQEAYVKGVKFCLDVYHVPSRLREGAVDVDCRSPYAGASFVGCRVSFVTTDGHRIKFFEAPGNRDRVNTYAKRRSPGAKCELSSNPYYFIDLTDGVLLLPPNSVCTLNGQPR